MGSSGSGYRNENVMCKKISFWRLESNLGHEMELKNQEYFSKNIWLHVWSNPVRLHP